MKPGLKDSKKLSKSRKGIVLGLGLFAFVAATNNVNAGYVEVKTTSADTSDPSVQLYHWPGALEGLDTVVDATYLESPLDPVTGNIDFYAATPFASPKDRLGIEGRPTTSLTPFHLDLYGRGLPGPVSTDLSFNIGLDTYFVGKPMWAYVSKADGTPVGGAIDIRDYSANGTTLTLDNITNGKMYHVDVKFEAPASSVPIPATFYLFSSGLLGLAGIAKKRKAV